MEFTVIDMDTMTSHDITFLMGAVDILKKRRRKAQDREERLLDLMKKATGSPLFHHIAKMHDQEKKDIITLNREINQIQNILDNQ